MGKTARTSTQAAPTKVAVRPAAGTGAVALAAPDSGLRFLKRLPVQAQVEVGKVDDPCEREAEAIATSMDAPSPMDPVAPGLGPRIRPQVQRVAATPRGVVAKVGPSSLDGALEHSQGDPMGDGVRIPLERSFGADFRSIRIHTDSRADAWSRSLQARAFTKGRDIYFRTGAFDPGTPRGRHLLVHELTHTIQQGATAGSYGGAPLIQRAWEEGLCSAPIIVRKDDGREMLVEEGDTLEVDTTESNGTSVRCKKGDVSGWIKVSDLENFLEDEEEVDLGGSGWLMGDMDPVDTLDEDPGVLEDLLQGMEGMAPHNIQEEQEVWGGVRNDPLIDEDSPASSRPVVTNAGLAAPRRPLPEIMSPLEWRRQSSVFGAMRGTRLQRIDRLLEQFHHTRQTEDFGAALHYLKALFFTILEWMKEKKRKDEHRRLLAGETLLLEVQAVLDDLGGIKGGDDEAYALRPSPATTGDLPPDQAPGTFSRLNQATGSATAASTAQAALKLAQHGLASIKDGRIDGIREGFFQNWDRVQGALANLHIIGSAMADVVLFVKSLKDSWDAWRDLNAFKDLAGATPIAHPLHEVGTYGSGKVRRRLIAALYGMVNKFVKILGAVLAPITVGASLVLTLASSSLSALKVAYSASKAAYKKFKGTLGVARRLNASVILNAVREKEAEATRLVLRLKLFGVVDKAKMSISGEKKPKDYPGPEKVEDPAAHDYVQRIFQRPEYYGTTQERLETMLQDKLKSG